MQGKVVIELLSSEKFHINLNTIFFYIVSNELDLYSIGTKDKPVNSDWVRVTVTNWTSHYHLNSLKSVFDNVLLLEHGGLSFVLPLFVHQE